MKYQILASDLDGTLLNNQAQVSKENLDAICELRQKGAWLVPCSGRTFSELPAAVREHPDVRYLIYSNGAVVLDRETGKRLVRGIPNQVGRRILELLFSYETHLTMRYQGECYVDADCQKPSDWEYYHLCEAHRSVLRDYAVRRQDLYGFAREADHVEVFSAFFHDYEEMLACKKRLEELDCLRVAEASEYNLEIFHKDAGKGNALYDLADMLGIDRAATIGVGDSDNDNSMLRAAGLGLAVSNACDSLKAIADQIICSNEEHVLPYIVSHYFKEKEQDA